MAYRYGIIICLFCLMMAGCSSNVESDIVGEWKGKVVKQDLVFHEDGRVEMKGHQHSVYYGNYKLEDDNKLTCVFEKLSQPVECTAKIKGDKLILTHQGGREEVYDRK